MALTPYNKVLMPGVIEKGSTIVVTSLDRLNRESAPTSLVVK